MEIVGFIAALLLIGGVALLALRRTPLEWRRQLPRGGEMPPDARTAEPPGRADDSG